MNRSDRNQLYLGLAAVAVVAGVVAGLLVIPAPGEERLRRLDQRRVDDLRAIAEAIDLYWTRHGRLPPSLELLADEPGAVVSVRDPDSGDVYELQVLAAPDYELCAHFARASDSELDGRGSGRQDGDTFWSHADGRHCYGLQAVELPARFQVPDPPRL